MSGEGNLKHGHCSIKDGSRESATYMSWKEMVARCRNKRHQNYDRYGGRGICVCERWLKFENFLADMGERPKGLTLERIDNSSNYTPGNCKWATRAEQARNTSKVVNITFRGKTMCLRQWAASLGINHQSLSRRLKRLPLEDALTIPSKM